MCLLLCAALLGAAEDPFQMPAELQAFSRKHTLAQSGVHAKLSSLVRAFFAPPEEGGLGITYDNAYTRTPTEAWRDRKANCLSLTILYVGACKSIGLEATYGESLRVSRWRRVGNIVRYERHVVAVIPGTVVGQQMVADFLPEVRRESQLIATLEPKRVLALFHSNRAVELMADARTGEALASAQQAITVDPKLGVGWNILGVVQRAQGRDAEAEKSFLRALEADPGDGAPCGNLELLLREQGREREAQVYRDRGLEVRKRDPFFNAFLAEEALQDGNLAEADRRIRAAIRILPQEPDFHLMQARICLAYGKSKDAIKALEKARECALPENQARYDAKLALIKGGQP